jgi:hypothetical protein
MARVNLAYPKIPGSKHWPSGRCVAFEKYDGTNLHWVWERELGWYAFGTRRNRFDLDDVGIAEFNKSHPGYEDAPAIFNREFAQALELSFGQNPDYDSDEITVFTEYLGEDSFAGLHKAEDPKQLVLFDIQTERGMVGPEQFVEEFGGLNIANVVYRGKLTGKFVADVRQGKFGVAEGVVCKGGSGESLWMIKIKTQAYMERLQKTFSDNWEDYWE